MRFLFILMFSATSLGLIGPRFHEIKRYALGGDGGWDTLTIDKDSHRLFVARSNRVMVIDTHSGKLEKEIADLAGVHGVAVVSEIGKGFISSGKTNTVVPFDLQSLKSEAAIPVGKIRT